MAGRITRRRRPSQMRAKFVAPHRSKADESVCHCAVIRRAKLPFICSSRVAGPRGGWRESQSAAPRSQPPGHRSFLADRAGGGTLGCGLPIRGDEGNGEARPGGVRVTRHESNSYYVVGRFVSLQLFGARPGLIRPRFTSISIRRHLGSVSRHTTLLQ